MKATLFAILLSATAPLAAEDVTEDIQCQTFDEVCPMSFGKIVSNKFGHRICECYQLTNEERNKILSVTKDDGSCWWI